MEITDDWADGYDPLKQGVVWYGKATLFFWFMLLQPRRNKKSSPRPKRCTGLLWGIVRNSKP